MAELEMIRIRHPKIDDGERVIEVPAQSLGIHERSGWVLVEKPAEESESEASGTTPEDPPAPPATSDEAPAEPGVSPSEDPQRRRRATAKDGE